MTHLEQQQHHFRSRDNEISMRFRNSLFLAIVIDIPTVCSRTREIKASVAD